MNDNDPTVPIWLRILQFPPVRLFLLGYPLFYCLGYSNAFMEQNKGNILPMIVVALAMVATLATEAMVEVPQ